MRRVKITGLVLISLIAYHSQASHIVGGEFELVHVQDFQYKLNLIQYFDEVHGNSEAEDDFANAYIFRKKDEVLVEVVRLDRVSSEFIKYTNPSCAEGDLVTRRIFYSATITLPPARYNDPEGYFVVYERCCRNEIISNLVDPGQNGQAFYMEFPPVVKNEKPFVDSSPVLAPPISDYACAGRKFYYDLRGADPDGDSLVYSLAVPFNSSVSSQPLPTPGGRPQRDVNFKPGIGLSNMIPGTPPLQISPEGILTVTPADTGVYVYGIKVEQYRGGVRIGEVRRDFQMQVLDCDPGSAPQVKGKVRNVLYQEGDLIQFAPGEARCIEVLVTDADPDERITLKAEGVNFPQDIQSLVPAAIFPLNGTSDTLRFNVCLPECPYTPEPMRINIIAFDNACSQPLSDTLRLTVDYDGPPNEDPFIENNPNVINAEITAGETYTLPLRGLDNDLDQLTLTATGEGFDLDDYGMSLVEELLVPGEVKKTFQWDASCALYDFTERSEFTVLISLSDDSDCSPGEPDLLRLRLKVNVPANNRPKVTLDELASREITIRIDETLAFDVIAEDKDGDLIRLFAVGDGFDLEAYNMSFQENAGIRKISSPFSWRLSCNNIDLGEKSRFDLSFIAEDQNNCSAPGGDTVRVTINIVPPDNDPPVARIRGVSADTVQAVVGQTVLLDVQGDDADVDLLTLRLAGITQDGVSLDPETTNFIFANVRAYGSVTSLLSWIPECSALAADGRSTFYELSFVVEDDKCFNAKSDSVSITVQLFDIPLNLDEYLPNNAFTPNSDGHGDYFYLPTLPRGNCYNRFEKIEIFSRWGNLVFIADNLDFRWYADGVSSGAYYYIVYYTRQQYKNRVYVYRDSP